MKWLEEKNAPISENVLLVYFSELSEKMQPSSLWSIYSRIKSTVKLYKKLI